MRKTAVAKRDVLVALGCVVFLLANLGAIGNGSRRRAKEAVCVSNLKRWGVIFRTFAGDNGGFFMDRGDAAGWPETLAPYYENPRILLCPEATKTYADGAVNPLMAWDCEMIDGTVYRGSYVINLWISDETDMREYSRFWRTPYVKDAAHAPVFLDGQWKDMQPYPSDEPLPYETHVWTPGPMHEMRRACISRHNGGVNAVFLDGSVRKVGLKFLWRLKWHREWPQDYPLPVWPSWMQNFKDP